VTAAKRAGLLHISAGALPTICNTSARLTCTAHKRVAQQGILHL
jgi:hypothetical protein